MILTSKGHLQFKDNFVLNRSLVYEARFNRWLQITAFITISSTPLSAAPFLSVRPHSLCLSALLSLVPISSCLPLVTSLLIYRERHPQTISSLVNAWNMSFQKHVISLQNILFTHSSILYQIMSYTNSDCDYLSTTLYMASVPFNKSTSDICAEIIPYSDSTVVIFLYDSKRVI